MAENAFAKIINTMNRNTKSQIISDGDDFLFGTVITINPLSIQIDNHANPLPASMFWVGESCRALTVNIPEHRHIYSGMTDNYTGDSAEFMGNTQNYTGDSQSFNGDSQNFSGNSDTALSNEFLHFHNILHLHNITHEHNITHMHNMIHLHNITHSHNYSGTTDAASGDEGYNEIVIRAGLKVNDRVLLFAFNQNSENKRFYVAERLG